MIFNYTKEMLENLHAVFTATEIHQQPETWLKTVQQIRGMKDSLQAFIDQVIKQEDFDVILTGAGTSEFVGNSAYSYLAKQLNYKVKSYGTTDLVATPENYLSKTKPTLLISYGRSGNSPESVAAVEVAEQVCETIYHVFITCNHEGALSKFAQSRKNCFAINLTPETHDQSFAMTSSFSNMYLATLLTFQLDQLDAVEMLIKDVKASADRYLNDNFGFAKDVVEQFDFNRIVYLGANTCKGIAQESALKMLELTAGKVVTMYDTPMGFRHGPKSIIDDQTLTVVYVSDDAYTRQYDIDLIREMSVQRKGNKILAVTNQVDEQVRELVDFYYAFENGCVLDNAYLGLEYITVAQTIALFKSLALDITPDNPCPSGEVNRVVKGVIIHPYKK
ncbi:MAG: SIS domain-containing protein [Erysipelotrichaceae bacterium]|nr:SIS domain-containing protein [Erysipelotrichaceae bacterium]